MQARQNKTNHKKRKRTRKIQSVHTPNCYEAKWPQEPS